MKILALVSGGIDYCFFINGYDVECVIFESTPFTKKEEVMTAKETIKKLSQKYGKKFKTYIVPHGKTQETFFNLVKESDLKYSCIFSRRMMLRISEKIANENGCSFLLTGDCLGQVASQTLDNLILIGNVSKIPVLRPIIGLDKLEIIKIAQEIGTYEVSIKGGISCAVNADYPETHGKQTEMERIESSLGTEKLMNAAVRNMIIEKI